jgi:hypothetical protein
MAGHKTRGSRRAALVACVVVISVLGSAAAKAAEDPCPPHLFTLARSKNANIVAYDANRGPAGDFDVSEPVIVYWLLDGDKDKREELNAIERQRAYGVDVKPGETPGTYAMVFRASPQRLVTIQVQKGCPVTSAQIGGREGILRKIFVQSKEGSLQPKVEYVELFGEDVATGGPLYEKLVPGK